MVEKILPRATTRRKFYHLAPYLVHSYIKGEKTDPDLQTEIVCIIFCWI